MSSYRLLGLLAHVLGVHVRSDEGKGKFARACWRCEIFKTIGIDSIELDFEGLRLAKAKKKK
jgi:hypothetical protein